MNSQQHIEVVTVGMAFFIAMVFFFAGIFAGALWYSHKPGKQKNQNKLVHLDFTEEAISD